MKTLFISIAFFLYAFPSLQKTNDPIAPVKGETILTLTELINFRSGEPLSMEKILSDRKFKKQNIKSANGETSWRFFDGGTERIVYLCPNSYKKYAGPGIRMSTYSEEEYEKLVEQAESGLHSLKECSDPSHEEMDEQHFSSKEINILFSSDEEYEFIKLVRVYGAKL